MQKIRILVPVGFSIQSDMALKQAEIIARHANVMITCLYVIERPGFITGMLMDKDLEQKIRREAEIQLSRKVNQIFPATEKIPFELIISTGSVHRKILEKASELHVDMIIMGKSDSKDPGTKYLGTNAGRILAKSNIPVLLVNREVTPESKRILLPLDLEERVSIKIAKSIELAESLNASLTVCTFIGQNRNGYKQASRSRLKLIEKIYSGYDIQCAWHVIEAKQKLAEEILSFAHEVKSDLIFIMTRKESNLSEMFIGSTAGEVIRNSDIPVISVTPGVRTRSYPYKALFGEVNTPLRYGDGRKHLILT